MGNELLLALPEQCRLTKRGLLLPDGIDRKTFEQIGPLFRAMEQASQWALGDYCLMAEIKYGKTYPDVSRLTGYEEKTCYNAVYVCRAFELSRRRENLSFRHHMELAPLTIAEQERWLNEATDNHYSVRELRAELKFWKEQQRQAGEPIEQEPISTTNAAVLPVGKIAQAETPAPSPAMTIGTAREVHQLELLPEPVETLPEQVIVSPDDLYNVQLNLVVPKGIVTLLDKMIAKTGHEHTYSTYICGMLRREAIRGGV